MISPQSTFMDTDAPDTPSMCVLNMGVQVVIQSAIETMSKQYLIKCAIIMENAMKEAMPKQFHK